MRSVVRAYVFNMAGRLSSKPIYISQGVTISLEHGTLLVKGIKGELSLAVPPEVTLQVSEDGKEAMVAPIKNIKEISRIMGTFYVHVRNMVMGVSSGFTKILELEGIGYRASMDGKDLVLSLGFSHPVRYTSPGGIDISTEKNEIRISGINKELVGQVAASIRMYRKPEPYKGKGIRYQGEHIVRKAGKKAGVGA